MSGNVLIEHQEIPVDGYRVEIFDSYAVFNIDIDDEPHPQEPFLIANKHAGSSFYNPIRDSSLFRIFSDLSDDEDDIVEFANKYGMISIGTPFELDGVTEIVEDLSTWRAEIHSLRKAVKLWDNIQSHNESWLRDRIYWKGNKNRLDTKVYYIFEFPGEGYYGEGYYDEDPRAGRSLIASMETNRSAFENFKYGDVVKPAKFYLVNLVNKVIKRRVTYEFRFNSDWTRLNNYIFASDLIGFMWLQLTLSIEGNLKYRRCDVCNKPFLVDPSERGKIRRFCSGACKAKDYRENKKKKAANE